MYYAALQGKALGHTAVTVVELGVAGGNGLVCLCDLKRDIQSEVGITINVVGFDTGEGLPKSEDPRDTLYAWPTGSYRMDRDALEKRIGGQAELVLGSVANTIASWNPKTESPLGAVLFDLDYFSSTSAALSILTKENILPRIWCYFDDVHGGPEEALTERIGEREAIRQFNASPMREVLNDHLSPAYAFKFLQQESWHERIFLYHRMSHRDYNVCLVGVDRDQLQLSKG
jgi:hypothetical protein